MKKIVFNPQNWHGSTSRFNHVKHRHSEFESNSKLLPEKVNIHDGSNRFPRKRWVECKLIEVLYFLEVRDESGCDVTTSEAKLKVLNAEKRETTTSDVISSSSELFFSAVMENQYFLNDRQTDDVESSLALTWKMIFSPSLSRSDKFSRW